MMKNRLFRSAGVSIVLSGLLGFVDGNATVFGQQLYEYALGFSPPMSEVGSVRALDGSGYTIYNYSNGGMGMTYLGPYQMTRYIDYSGVPAYYGPLNQRYLLQQPTYWRNFGASVSSDASRSYYGQTQGTNGNKDAPRSVRNAANKSALAKRKEATKVAQVLPKAREEKPTPIPFTLDENNRLPHWIVSATEFIDRFVKAGEVTDALAACDRLIETRTGLPSEIYTRAAVLALIDGRNLDDVVRYVNEATTNGQRMNGQQLPGGSLEKYLPQTERRRFVEAMLQLNGKLNSDGLSEEQIKAINALRGL